MQKYFFLLLTCLFSSTFLFAQHCPYCGSAIISVYPVSPQSNALIPGLKISLVEKDGKPKMISEPRFNKKGNYTHSEITEALFWQNPPNTTHYGYIDNNTPDNPSKRRFFFAADHYVYKTCRYPCSDSLLMIQIEDVDGQANGGEFETIRIPVTKEIKFGLCGMTSSYFDTKEYKPAHVQLLPKNYAGKKPWSWHDKVFRYTLDFNPTGLKIPLTKQNYAYLFRVYPLYKDTLIHKMIIYGSERSKCNPIPETGDYNFDGHTDFRVCHQIYPGRHDYYIYDSIQNQFLQDTLLSKLFNLSVDPVNQIIQGYMSSPQHIADYTFYERGLMRMSVVTHRPAVAGNRNYQTDYRRKGDSWERYIRNTDSLQTYEEADYNFDGHVDYRINHDSTPNRHRYYIYHPEAGKHLLDTMLSKMTGIQYNWATKLFRGSITTEAELVKQVDIYEWTATGYLLTEMIISTRPHRLSESIRIMYYKLVDGKMTFVDMGGAE